VELLSVLFHCRNSSSCHVYGICEKVQKQDCRLYHCVFSGESHLILLHNSRYGCSIVMTAYTCFTGIFIQWVTQYSNNKNIPYQNVILFDISTRDSYKYTITHTAQLRRTGDVYDMETVSTGY